MRIQAFATVSKDSLPMKYVWRILIPAGKTYRQVDDQSNWMLLQLPFTERFDWVEDKIFKDTIY